MKGARDIGVDVSSPQGEWDGDPNDPFYGTLPVRGQMLKGVVVKDKAQRTAVISIERTRFDTKYERFEKRTSKISAHSPTSVGAKEGDRVTIMECRPLSKTKSFVIIEKEGNE